MHNGGAGYGGGYGPEYGHAQYRPGTGLTPMNEAGTRRREDVAKRQAQARGLSKQTLASGMTWNQVLSMHGYSWAAALHYWNEQRDLERSPGGRAWNSGPTQPAGPPPSYGHAPGPQEWQAQDIYQRRREDDFVEHVEERMAWEMYDDVMHRMAVSMKDALWEQHQKDLRREARREAERERRDPYGNDPRDR